MFREKSKRSKFAPASRPRALWQQTCSRLPCRPNFKKNKANLTRPQLDAGPILLLPVPVPNLDSKPARWVPPTGNGGERSSPQPLLKPLLSPPLNNRNKFQHSCFGATVSGGYQQLFYSNRKGKNVPPRRGEPDPFDENGPPGHVCRAAAITRAPFDEVRFRPGPLGPGLVPPLRNCIAWVLALPLRCGPERRPPPREGSCPMPHPWALAAGRVPPHPPRAATRKTGPRRVPQR